MRGGHPPARAEFGAGVALGARGTPRALRAPELGRARGRYDARRTARLERHRTERRASGSGGGDQAPSRDRRLSRHCVGRWGTGSDPPRRGRARHLAPSTSCSCSPTRGWWWPVVFQSHATLTGAAWFSLLRIAGSPPRRRAHAREPPVPSLAAAFARLTFVTPAEALSSITAAAVRSSKVQQGLLTDVRPVAGRVLRRRP